MCFSCLDSQNGPKPKKCTLVVSEQGKRNDLKQSQSDVGRQDVATSQTGRDVSTTPTAKSTHDGASVAKPHPRRDVPTTLAEDASWTTDNSDSESSDDDSSYSDSSQSSQDHHGFHVDSLRNKFDTHDGTEDGATFLAAPKSSKCTGLRRLWEICPGTNSLSCFEIESRVTVRADAKSVGLLESTQLTTKQLRRRLFKVPIVFRRSSNSPWRYGFIHQYSLLSSIGDTQPDRPGGVLSVYEWTGPTVIDDDGYCYPKLFVDAGNWRQHLTLTDICFSKRSGVSWHYVNQFCGKALDGFEFAPDLINELDHKLQCSPAGPDANVPIKLSHTRWDSSMGDLLKNDPIRSDAFRHPNVIRKVKNSSGSKRCREKLRQQHAVAPIIREWNKPLKHDFVPGTKTAVAVVTKIDGRPIDRNDTTSIRSDLERKFFFASPTDFLANTVEQRVYAATRDQHASLTGVRFGLDNVEAILQERTYCTLTTISINDCALWEDQPDFYNVCHVFAGDATPSFDGFLTTKLPDWGLMIHYSIMPVASVSMFTPMSVSLVDPATHAMQLTHDHVMVFRNAFSGVGSYPTRSICDSVGHNTYQAYKTNNSQSNLTPTEGPGQREKFRLYRQYIDPRFAPAAMAILNELSKTTFWRGAFLFHQTLFLGGYGSSPEMLGPSRIQIETIDFDNTPHIDEYDMATKAREEDAVKTAEMVKDSPLTSPKNAGKLANYLAFVKNFGMSMTTTCCYQFVPKPSHSSNMDVLGHPRVRVCQVFMMPGLGMSHRVQNYWTHTFHAASFQHNTCVPMFVSNNSVQFGSHEEWWVQAWGSGSLAQRQARAARREREAREAAIAAEREAAQQARAAELAQAAAARAARHDRLNEVRDSPPRGRRGGQRGSGGGAGGGAGGGDVGGQPEPPTPRDVRLARLNAAREAREAGSPGRLDGGAGAGGGGGGGRGDGNGGGPGRGAVSRGGGGRGDDGGGGVGSEQFSAEVRAPSRRPNPRFVDAFIRSFSSSRRFNPRDDTNVLGNVTFAELPGGVIPQEIATHNAGLMRFLRRNIDAGPVNDFLNQMQTESREQGNWSMHDVNVRLRGFAQEALDEYLDRVNGC